MNNDIFHLLLIPKTAIIVYITAKSSNNKDDFMTAYGGEYESTYSTNGEVSGR
jgi:hypothetical protein